ncbi:TIGR01459 family HAD-type hydrolase [Rickettsia endosymbiont of Cardiosporidium cionae]|uniref:TIGR01459 family HAD-type hydrolase n=1 Tax=Rickettsia endosymbiont of Cardiosporidium cionae TaxID=2777155 RepID=UPI001894A05E|nr:TIGR01459 family HAD-type hydrolase [Rickettsia endosymbiont of Cardiosporidium cionae]KAF8818162.1 TIGR01459 family HAD-type hydrolase [Rickettsia endosymbiont of Cardiosporidium cionae]
MYKIKFHHILSVIERYDILLLDIWGVIFEDSSVYHEVIEFVNHIIKQKQVFFISNAPRIKSAIISVLHNVGLTGIRDSMVITSGEIARKKILDIKQSKNIKNIRIYHLGNNLHTDLLNNIDYTASNKLSDTDILLLTLSKNSNDNLTEFDNLLKEAALMPNIVNICANPDIVSPHPDRINYCSGYFANILEQHGGKVIYTGKPKQDIYLEILNNIQNIEPQKILMIGDTLETDILGAMGSKIDSAIVMTGNIEKIHKSYKSFEEKLQAINSHIDKIGIYPNFITKLGLHS